MEIGDLARWRGDRSGRGANMERRSGKQGENQREKNQRPDKRLESRSLVGWVSAAQPTIPKTLAVGCAALTHPTNSCGFSLFVGSLKRIRGRGQTSKAQGRDQAPPQNP